MQDRFGDFPLEVDNLSEVMAIKADMRRLRLRTLESGPGSRPPRTHPAAARRRGRRAPWSGAWATEDRLTDRASLLEHTNTDAID
jgi:hypothetical protein